MSPNDASSTCPDVSTLTAETSPLVFVPCFAGAAWDVGSLPHVANRTHLTPELPDGPDSISSYVGHLADVVAPLDRYWLVGDSFGAVVALSLAANRPEGLQGLVLSGGFARDPLPVWKAAAARTAHLWTGPLYRQLTLRFHAWQLASRFDQAGSAEVPHTQHDYRRYFAANTPSHAYAARARAVLGFDVRDRLAAIAVPTLILTPEDDRLVGDTAASELVEGIPEATEQVLPGTGHMFRFTHPTRYSRAIANFVDAHSNTPADWSESTEGPRLTEVAQ